MVRGPYNLEINPDFKFEIRISPDLIKLAETIPNLELLKFQTF